jgi:chromosome partitioning protein
MRIISLANQKGGTGKTTTAVNLGAGLAQLNKKVLMIDLDPQANLTIGFGLKPKELQFTLVDLFDSKAGPADVIYNTTIKNLDVIPSNTELTKFDVSITDHVGFENILSDRLKDVSKYDFIIIDSPPHLGMLTVNGFIFCNELIIPLQVEYYALEGLVKLLRTINLVRTRFEKDISLCGIVATMYDLRTNLSQQIHAIIKKQWGEKVFKTIIRDNVRLAEAPSFGMTIFDYAPTSYGAEDYLNLAKEVINRG